MLDANPEAKAAVGKEILAGAIEVAKASGGFFGIGDRVSAEERTVLETIAHGLGAKP
jgi:tellurite resistance protein